MDREINPRYYTACAVRCPHCDGLVEPIAFFKVLPSCLAVVWKYVARCGVKLYPGLTAIESARRDIHKARTYLRFEEERLDDLEKFEGRYANPRKEVPSEVPAGSDPDSGCDKDACVGADWLAIPHGAGPGCHSPDGA